MGLFTADQIVIPPAPQPTPTPTPAPTPAPAAPCCCPPAASPAPPPVPPQGNVIALPPGYLPPGYYPPQPGNYPPQPAPGQAGGYYPPQPGNYPPQPAPGGYYPPGNYPPQPAPPVQPPPAQQPANQGAWTDSNGIHYMSPNLAISYYTSSLLTATGQAHLIAGASDQQLLNDYRNGDVTSPVLTLFGITVPKGLTQVKQSPMMASPEFPQVAIGQNQAPIIFQGGSWTFNVPAGWQYSVGTTAPSLNINLSLGGAATSLPANVVYSVDAVRSTHTVRPDGSQDVTVFGIWTEVLPSTTQMVADIPAGAYSAYIMATLFPTDNPPPSV